MIFTFSLLCITTVFTGLSNAAPSPHSLLHQAINEKISDAFAQVKLQIDQTLMLKNTKASARLNDEMASLQTRLLARLEDDLDSTADSSMDNMQLAMALKPKWEASLQSELDGWKNDVAKWAEQNQQVWQGVEQKVIQSAQKAIAFFDSINPLKQVCPAPSVSSRSTSMSVKDSLRDDVLFKRAGLHIPTVVTFVIGSFAGVGLALLIFSIQLFRALEHMPI